MIANRLLVKSIEPFLGPGEEVILAAPAWRRNTPLGRLVPIGVAVGLALAVVARWLWDVPTSLVDTIGLVFAVVLAAVAASTSHYIVARTSHGYLLLGGSRIRKAATGLVERFEPGTSLVRESASMVTGTWLVGEHRLWCSKHGDRVLSLMVDAEGGPA